MPLPISKNLANESVIDFDSVSFAYASGLILSNVSFQVFPGEFIGMIGPNGGGKTTLLKLILGFLKNYKGSIKVLGRNPSNHSTLIPRIAYVPQSIRFDRDFPISVEEVVLSGLISKLPWYGLFGQKEKQQAKELLKKMELEHLSKQPFGSLSGGQAQRVLIARALISEPELLLLDEPTASVDSQAEADIYAILRSLKGKMTVLMVTHDLNAAIDQVERVLCVQRKVISLKPEEVCKHFAIGLYHEPLLPSTSSNSNLQS